MRVHVVLPDDLVRNVDRLAGRRRRSAFISQVLEERLRRERLSQALEETAGIVRAEDYSHWATSAKVAAWVRKLRRQKSRRVGPPFG